MTEPQAPYKVQNGFRTITRFGAVRVAMDSTRGLWFLYDNGNKRKVRHPKEVGDMAQLIEYLRGELVAVGGEGC